MEWDFGALGTPGRYKLLVALVTPRPIAFVSTRGGDGVDNAAPFSFFNVLAEDPPVVIVSIERKPDGRSKDSGRNILETGEFVVNMVDEGLLERMHHCSVEFPAEVSEFAQAGLTAAPARKVAAPRIAESPVSMECRLHTRVPFEKRDLVIGEIVWLHVRDGIVDPQTLRVTAEYAPVGRLYANLYTRTRDRVALDQNAYIEAMRRLGRA
ncbi:MAG: flavin reductase family protein [Burkholderiales bacterium]